MLAFTSKTLITPTEKINRALLLVEDGKIVEVASSEERAVPAEIRRVDFDDGWIAPGYIDLHIHGCGGVGVMDDNVHALVGIEGKLVQTRVTSYCPIPVTAPTDTTTPSP